jgi:hypothetical protein
MCLVFRVFLLLILGLNTQKTCQRLPGLCAASAPSSGCFYFLSLTGYPNDMPAQSTTMMFSRGGFSPRLSGVYTSYP